jgi:hypothetical protein
MADFMGQTDTRTDTRFSQVNGAYRDRTCDLLVANQALSQLS